MGGIHACNPLFGCYLVHAAKPGDFAIENKAVMDGFLCKPERMGECKVGVSDPGEIMVGVINRLPAQTGNQCGMGYACVGHAEKQGACRD